MNRQAKICSLHFYSLALLSVPAGNRTRTVARPQDFKSCVSTSSNHLAIQNQSYITFSNLLKTHSETCSLSKILPSQNSLWNNKNSNPKDRVYRFAVQQNKTLKKLLNWEFWRRLLELATPGPWQGRASTPRAFCLNLSTAFSESFGTAKLRIFWIKKQREMDQKLFWILAFILIIALFSKVIQNRNEKWLPARPVTSPIAFWFHLVCSMLDRCEIVYIPRKISSRICSKNGSSSWNQT